MDRFPPKEVVERLREQYPIGSRIELVSMDDPYNDRLKSGDEGTVGFIDDTGTIFADWDNGSKLGLVYGVDSYRKLEYEPDFVTGNSTLEASILQDKALIRQCIDGLGAYAMDI